MDSLRKKLHLNRKASFDIKKPEELYALANQSGDTPNALANQNGDTPIDYTPAHRDDSARGNWANPLDFIMSLVAYCVGLGNIWRFPYLCFKNGGGAFLIPYAVYWTLAAVPTFFLEVSIGQYIGEGGIGIWKICPIFKGAGIAALVISTYCNIYYCVIVVWALYHMFASFQYALPWVKCGMAWNDARCLHGLDNSTNYTERLINLISEGFEANDSQSPVEQFWE